MAAVRAELRRARRRDRQAVRDGEPDLRRGARLRPRGWRCASGSSRRSGRSWMRSSAGSGPAARDRRAVAAARRGGVPGRPRAWRTCARRFAPASAPPGAAPPRWPRGPGVSAPATIALAEAIFVYGDELATDVVEGYLRIQSDQAGERERRRRRLASAAARSRRPRSRERSPAPLSSRTGRCPRRRCRGRPSRARPGGAGPPARPRRRSAGADGDGAWLVLPDPDGPGRRAAVDHALAGEPAAVGPDRGARRGAPVAALGAARARGRRRARPVARPRRRPPGRAHPAPGPRARRAARPDAPGGARRPARRRARAPHRDAGGVARPPAPHPGHRRRSSTSTLRPSATASPSCASSSVTRWTPATGGSSSGLALRISASGK